MTYDYVRVLQEGTRKARKTHQCFHCYRDIAPGQIYGFHTNVYDGTVRTFIWHLDCDACAKTWRDNISDVLNWDEGWGPLRDEWKDGDYGQECSAWRGFFPHVVARMELTDQLRDARAAQKGE